MRQRLSIAVFGGICLILASCSKSLSLSGGNSKAIKQSVVESPSTDSKGDRPTEAGEGLPGYLIDPVKLQIQSNNGQWTVTGNQALRNSAGEAVSASVWLIKIPKKTVTLEAQGKSWQMEGIKIAETPSDSQGSFQLKGELTPDDILFVKIADSKGSRIEYQDTGVSASTLWIDGTTAKALDSTNSLVITAAVTAAQPAGVPTTLEGKIAQIKSTGTCRNCDLTGADLSGLNIPNCDLAYSNITGAKFVLTDVSTCDFSYSNLSMADFSQANLSNANLTATDISGAKFTGANVSGVVGQTLSPN